ARNVELENANASNVHDEDAKKPGFTPEGKAAGQNAMVAFGAPERALERWIGRLASRAPLLSAQVQSVGVGYAVNEKGQWICVLDPVRGRGDQIVIFPSPKLLDVPAYFSGGPEAP